jgi:hypothetical protein
MSAPEPTYLTHEPSPLFASAEACSHIEPSEPVHGRAGLPDDDGGQWAAWASDHPTVIDEDGIPRGRRFCLDTPVGEYCPACTEYATEEFDLPTDAFILAADCTHTAVTP